ncbi:branched-chain amino acid ABC transporter permease [Reinekea blandensis]|uniref:Inner-membrane translocator n=1 Tax=Reinekea blandensis MED297 TaxID=314283 RepID=A4BB19_9GAMM|nr:branched-chain amino acid ABC transporter permease [Reinekea blandensis]EAR10632.1 inner-membrane translocator [Reinekea sp. MED297] [Reinekea blandensis MED297]
MITGNFKTSYAADESLWNNWAKRYGFVLAVVFLLVLPLFADNYVLLLAGQIAIYVIAVTGVNVLVGYTGLMSLGHGAFFAVGAYTTVILHQYVEHLFPLITLLVSIVVAAGFGFLFGLPSLRVKGLYLAVATLSANFIILFFIRQDWAAPWTGGRQGIETPNAMFFGQEMLSNTQKYYFIIPICLAMVLFAQNLFRTRFGRALIGIRDNDHSAEILGISLYAYKLKSFAISAAYCGAAGSLWAYFFPAILPEDFSLNLSITLVVCLIAGGMGRTLGPVFGTLLILLIPEMLKIVSGWATGGDGRALIHFSSIRDIVFGLIIILFLIFEPMGLVSIWDRFWRVVARWPFSK